MHHRLHFSLQSSLHKAQPLWRIITNLLVICFCCCCVASSVQWKGKQWWTRCFFGSSLSLPFIFNSIFDDHARTSGGDALFHWVAVEKGPMHGWLCCANASVCLHGVMFGQRWSKQNKMLWSFQIDSIESIDSNMHFLFYYYSSFRLRCFPRRYSSFHYFEINNNDNDNSFIY